MENKKVYLVYARIAIENEKSIFINYENVCVGVYDTFGKAHEVLEKVFDLESEIERKDDARFAVVQAFLREMELNPSTLSSTEIKNILRI